MITLQAVLTVVGATAVTYFVHSTLLLGMTWCLDARCGMGLALREQLWKCAAALGLVTSIAQVALVGLYPQLGWSPSRFDVQLLNRPARPSPPAGETWRRRSVEHNVAPQFVERANRRGLSDGKSSDSTSSPPPAPRRATAATTRGAPSYAGGDNAITPGANASPGERRIPSVALAAAAIVAIVFLSVGLLLSVTQLLALPSRYRCARLVRDGPALRLLEELLTRNTIRSRVRLLLADGTEEPLAFGFFRWTIVLPKTAIELLTESELRALLAHEVAHLVRRDFWWLWIGKLLCCCLPIQPLNFLARRRWQRATEQLCDDWAVRHGADRTSLAKCLIRVAEWRLKPQPSPVVFATGHNETTLALRVRRLLGQEAYTSDVPCHSRVAMRAVTVAAGCFILWFAPGAAFTVSTAALAAEPGEGTHEQFPESAAGNVPGRWLSLNEDLRRLDEQLVTLDILLEQHHLEPSAARIAEELRLHAERLRDRRDRVARKLF